MLTNTRICDQLTSLYPDFGACGDTLGGRHCVGAQETASGGCHAVVGCGPGSGLQ